MLVQVGGWAATMSRWELSPWWAIFSTDSHRVSHPHTHFPSKALPVLIRWQIRLFCYLTGLSTLWGWVSKLVGTLRGIKNMVIWLSRIWRFMVGFPSRFKWFAAVIKAMTGSQEEESSESLTDTSLQKLTHDLSSISSTHTQGLRLILLGPSGGGRTSLADTLLGAGGTIVSKDPLTQSTRWRTVVDGRDLTLIDTPDVLGTSMPNDQRAREALRSLQLTSPGPHAVLLVIRAPGTSTGIDQDATRAIRAAAELFGDGISEYIIPVLTHADCLRRQDDVDEDAWNLKGITALCGQRPELVVFSRASDLPPKEQSALRQQLLKRAMQMKEGGEHFAHELQRREDHLREELLTDMSTALARKLGHM
ncbi:GTPase IMAP family member 9-like isoform 2-T3 [Menidia menidia]